MRDQSRHTGARYRAANTRQWCVEQVCRPLPAMQPPAELGGHSSSRDRRRRSSGDSARPEPSARLGTTGRPALRGAIAKGLHLVTSLLAYLRVNFGPAHVSSTKRAGTRRAERWMSVYSRIATTADSYDAREASALGSVHTWAGDVGLGTPAVVGPRRSAARVVPPR